MYKYVIVNLIIIVRNKLKVIYESINLNSEILNSTLLVRIYLLSCNSLLCFSFAPSQLNCFCLEKRDQAIVYFALANNMTYSEDTHVKNNNKLYIFFGSNCSHKVNNIFSNCCFLKRNVWKWKKKKKVIYHWRPLRLYQRHNKNIYD